MNPIFPLFQVFYVYYFEALLFKMNEMVEH